MKKTLLTAVCAGVLALGIANVQAAKDMPLPVPPHGDEMLPPPPPGAEKDMAKKMAKLEKKMSKSWLISLV